MQSIKTGPHWSTMVPSPCMTGVLVTRGEDTRMGGMPCASGGRDWMKARLFGVSKPRKAKASKQPPATGRGEDRPSPRACRVSMALGHLDERFLASPALREQVCVVLSQPICGSRRQQEAEPALECPCPCPVLALFHLTSLRPFTSRRL